MKRSQSTRGSQQRFFHAHSVEGKDSHSGINHHQSLNMKRGADFPCIYLFFSGIYGLSVRLSHNED